ncbi:MAG: hypothetical protein H8E34_11570 [Bacteroidetes bacterium]|nr:hypothetical protein [Bacteroidota bacterium]MBL6944396.1 hypothetical protein [Bacteroidales bacterium]
MAISTSIKAGEEGRSISFEKRKSWNKLWIVDPLDGTKEFVKKKIVSSLLILLSLKITYPY